MTRRVPLPVLNNPTARAHAGGVNHETYEKKEKCGVFGVWGGKTNAYTTYTGLFAQQHRGQEAAGIAVSNGVHLDAYADMGLVADVFKQPTLDRLEPLATRGAIGHTRYSTAGGSIKCNAQPLLERYSGGQVAIAHNGNLVNADALKARFEAAGSLFHTTSDTEVVIHLLASPQQQSTPDPLASALRHLQGAFSLVLLFPDRIEAARDPWGWRPLVLGELAGGGLVVASETVALDVISARFIREVEPGEIVTLSARGIESRRFSPPSARLARCVFEHVYFANPASVVFGDNVQLARERMGERLAAEAPVQADYIMPMPDSGRSAAIGYARASCIHYREGIVPNRYVGRTFIKPTQDQRVSSVRLKLNVVRELVEGKRLVIVDDSIVRGTTTKLKVLQLREAGAKEIHLRISCPPIMHPCFFGVDFAKRSELVAASRTVEEIRKLLEVDSLAYLSLEGLLSCVRHDPKDYCTACYTGDYRIDVDHPVTDEAVGPQLRIFG